MAPPPAPCASSSPVAGINTCSSPRKPATGAADVPGRDAVSEGGGFIMHDVRQGPVLDPRCWCCQKSMSLLRRLRLSCPCLHRGWGRRGALGRYARRRRRRRSCPERGAGGGDKGSRQTIRVAGPPRLPSCQRPQPRAWPQLLHLAGSGLAGGPCSGTLRSSAGGRPRGPLHIQHPMNPMVVRPLAQTHRVPVPVLAFAFPITPAYRVAPAASSSAQPPALAAAASPPPPPPPSPSAPPPRQAPAPGLPPALTPAPPLCAVRRPVPTAAAGPAAVGLVNRVPQRWRQGPAQRCRHRQRRRQHLHKQQRRPPDGPVAATRVINATIFVHARARLLHLGAGSGFWVWCGWRSSCC